METTHDFYAENSQDLSFLDDNSVDLVVTSPPYPMIEMWDEAFSDMNSSVEKALHKDEGSTAFDEMHNVLDEVWHSIDEVISDSGIVCINIGDATRKIGEKFELYPNHSRIIQTFRELGYSVLPCVLWRKPTNKANKFMGSGMIPPNAYVTLEHEYILIFRKGGTRTLRGPDKEKRYTSSYFWEERNTWFSDVWMNILGTSQTIENTERNRTAAFPLEIPYRLINMYSIHGDTVLDPFVGTGTTSIAASAAARNSIGVDVSSEFIDAARNRFVDSVEIAEEVAEKRIKSHKEFMNTSDKTANYEAENYDIGVLTKQEKEIQFYSIDSVEDIDDGYRVTHKLYSK